ncbi:hypothetical protein QJS66_04690 [Kocuria rhizophila]|nr:hypothetical protein QJS66_04690 [Kocuria rhizophila]
MSAKGIGGGHRGGSAGQVQLVGGLRPWAFTLLTHQDVRSWTAAGTSGSPRAWRAHHRAPGDACGLPVVERKDAIDPRTARTCWPRRGTTPLIHGAPAGVHGERTHTPDHPQEGTLRGGHITRRRPVPWARAAGEDGTFRSRKLARGHLPGRGGLTPART